MAQSTWVSNGTYFQSPILSKDVRTQASAMFLFRQFTDLKQALGARRGDTVEFTKRLLIDTRGGTLVETNTIPENTIKFTQESVVVTEYGNAIRNTLKAEILAQIDLPENFRKGIAIDMRDTIDNAIATEFKTAKYKVVCTATGGIATTSNGTATATASNNPTDTNIRKIVSFMKKNWIPTVSGGSHYIGILSVEAHEGVYNSLQAIAQYTDPNFRFKSESGSYYGVRFMEDTNILLNTIGNGSAFGEGLIFGDEAVCEAVAMIEELRYEEKDVGRDKKLAWLGILGFKKIWDAVNDNQNSTTKGTERIVHITSA